MASKTAAWLIIPGGKRAIKDWGPPAISRKNPAAARYYGPGSCGTIYEGAVGNGSFVWPTVNHTISGYSFDSNVHPGVDFGGPAGNSVFATDAGVVVYAGWSNFGYGNLIVIDHGNGWQSAYAHLSGCRGLLRDERISGRRDRRSRHDGQLVRAAPALRAGLQRRQGQRDGLSALNSLTELFVQITLNWHNRGYAPWCNTL